MFMLFVMFHFGVYIMLLAICVFVLVYYYLFKKFKGFRDLYDRNLGSKIK